MGGQVTLTLNGTEYRTPEDWAAPLIADKAEHALAGLYAAGHRIPPEVAEDLPGEVWLVLHDRAEDEGLTVTDYLQHLHAEDDGRNPEGDGYAAAYVFKVARNLAAATDKDRHRVTLTGRAEDLDGFTLPDTGGPLTDYGAEPKRERLAYAPTPRAWFRKAFGCDPEDWGATDFADAAGKVAPWRAETYHRGLPGAAGTVTGYHRQAKEARDHNGPPPDDEHRKLKARQDRTNRAKRRQAARRHART